MKLTLTSLCFGLLLVQLSCNTPRVHDGHGHLGFEDPQVAVEQLYKDHDAGSSPFFQDKSRALVDRYFTRSTAELIWADAIAPKNPMGVMHGIGADPLYDAQDTQIANLKITQTSKEANQATAIASFENFGKPRKIDYRLLLENGAWKIEDIDYGTHTLLAQFR